MELTTTRLVLRPYAEGDLDAVHAYGSCPENVRYMIWGPNTEKETAEFLAECLSRQGEVPRLKHDFAITLRENGRLIGGCGIYLDKEQTEGMLGWILHRDFWGHGYVPEAAQALMRFGFDTLRLHRLWASCNAENTASWRVMEKCGMRREARFVKARFGRVGEERRWYDEFRYALLEGECTAQESADGAMRVRRIMHKSREYAAELALRDTILRKPLGLDLFAEDLNAESDDIHLGTFEDGALLGVLILTPQEKSVRMRQVAVDEGRQHGGIGTALVDAAERMAAALGYARMELHARETAAAFYERLGYEAKGEPFTEVGILHREMAKPLGKRHERI